MNNLFNVDDLMRKCFTYLKFKELLSSLKVCKRWKNQVLHRSSFNLSIQCKWKWNIISFDSKMGCGHFMPKLLIKNRKKYDQLLLKEQTPINMSHFPFCNIIDLTLYIDDKNDLQQIVDNDLFGQVSNSLTKLQLHTFNTLNVLSKDKIHFVELINCGLLKLKNLQYLLLNDLPVDSTKEEFIIWLDLLKNNTQLKSMTIQDFYSDFPIKQEKFMENIKTILQWNKLTNFHYQSYNQTSFCNNFNIDMLLNNCQDLYGLSIDLNYLSTTTICNITLKSPNFHLKHLYLTMINLQFIDFVNMFIALPNLQSIYLLLLNGINDCMPENIDSFYNKVKNHQNLSLLCIDSNPVYPTSMILPNYYLQLISKFPNLQFLHVPYITYKVLNIFSNCQFLRFLEVSTYLSKPELKYRFGQTRPRTIHMLPEEISCSVMHEINEKRIQNKFLYCVLFKNKSQQESIVYREFLKRFQTIY